MLNITLEQLEQLDACSGGFEWFGDKYPAKEVGLFDLRAHLEAEDKEEWFNWLLVRLLNRENKVKYAIYAAELVLHIYEDKYPDDDRPRKAIEAAKNCLESGYTRDAENTLAASWSAWSDAAEAAWSADTADTAVWSAAWSAWSAARDAEAKKETYKKILDYGIELLKQQEK